MYKEYAQETSSHGRAKDVKHEEDEPSPIKEEVIGAAAGSPHTAVEVGKKQNQPEPTDGEVQIRSPFAACELIPAALAGPRHFPCSEIQERRG